MRLQVQRLSLPVCLETPAVATSSLEALRVDADGVVKMHVDTGLRGNRAENYISPLLKLATDKMRTRHKEISTWTAYCEKLT